MPTLWLLTLSPPPLPGFLLIPRHRRPVCPFTKRLHLTLDMLEDMLVILVPLRAMYPHHLLASLWRSIKCLWVHQDRLLRPLRL